MVEQTTTSHEKTTSFLPIDGIVFTATTSMSASISLLGKMPSSGLTPIPSWEAVKLKKAACVEGKAGGPLGQGPAILFDKGVEEQRR